MRKCAVWAPSANHDRKKRHDWNIVESGAENIQGLSNANESDETLDNI
jgi:hypothetical protein